MRTVVWSAAAGGQFDRWIDRLTHDAGNGRAQEAQLEVTIRVARLSTRALAYRRSQLWPGLYELSLQPWHKLIVYSVEVTRVDVLGFYDMRQDLSRLRP